MNTLQYFGRLLCTLGWRSPLPGRRAALLAIAAAVTIGSAAVYGSDHVFEKRSGGIRALNARALEVATMLDRVEEVYGEEVAPIERVLMTYRRDEPQLVRRVAVSLVRESRRVGMEPRLLLAVLLVENPWIDPEARSPVGAQGLMQVMPFHVGNWKACAPRLDDIESNICHGASIFASYLKSEKGNIDRALLRYNGCVRGTNTPNCHQYPQHVYARAGRASLLAWPTTPARGGTLAASR